MGSSSSAQQNGTHLLFLRGLLTDGGDLGRRCPLARASLQQVNPGGPRALVVLEVEEHVLVEGEVLLGPAAVLRGLLAQEAALRALFTRDHRQIQSVALIVPHALLHFTLVFYFGYQLQTVTPGTIFTSSFGGSVPKRKLLISRFAGEKVIQAYHGIKSWSASGAAHITPRGTPDRGFTVSCPRGATGNTSRRLHAPKFGEELPGARANERLSARAAKMYENKAAYRTVSGAQRK